MPPHHSQCSKKRKTFNNFCFWVSHGAYVQVGRRGLAIRGRGRSDGTSVLVAVGLVAAHLAIRFVHVHIVVENRVDLGPFAIDDPVVDLVVSVIALDVRSHQYCRVVCEFGVFFKNPSYMWELWYFTIIFVSCSGLVEVVLLVRLLDHVLRLVLLRRYARDVLVRTLQVRGVCVLGHAHRPDLLQRVSHHADTKL